MSHPHSHGQWPKSSEATDRKSFGCISLQSIIHRVTQVMRSQSHASAYELTMYRTGKGISFSQSGQSLWHHFFTAVPWHDKESARIIMQSQHWLEVQVQLFILHSVELEGRWEIVLVPDLLALLFTDYFGFWCFPGKRGGQKLGCLFFFSFFLSSPPCKYRDFFVSFLMWTLTKFQSIEYFPFGLCSLKEHPNGGFHPLEELQP